MSQLHPLIDVQTLHETAAGLRLIDCSHDLGQTELGRKQYVEGHLPGAVHAHLDQDLSGAVTGRNGRHPLPSISAFVDWLGRQGVGRKTTVVAYDRSGGMYAARLWWMLHWIGHRSVRVLDGGWQAWVHAGLPVESGSVTPHACAYAADGFPSDLTVDMDFVLRNLTSREAVLIDARAAGRYAGEGETMDPVGGHIPGALNRPFTNNLDARGCFKPAPALQSEWRDLLGPHRLGSPSAGEGLVMQCGSGVTACHNLLSLELAGFSGARLYPGSWSEWCSDRSRPVATGPQP
jgi:thiosulfate/3-mercaptopyruvate sulfurtransferase